MQKLVKNLMKKQRWMIVLTLAIVIISYLINPPLPDNPIDSRGNCVKSTNNKYLCVHCHWLNLQLDHGYVVSLTNPKGIQILITPTSNQTIYEGCWKYSDLFQHYQAPLQAKDLNIQNIPQIKQLISERNLQVKTSPSQIRLFSGNYQYIVIFEVNDSQNFETVVRISRPYDSNNIFAINSSIIAILIILIVALIKLFSKRKIVLSLICRIAVLAMIIQKSIQVDIFFTLNMYEMPTFIFFALAMHQLQINIKLILTFLLLFSFGILYNLRYLLAIGNGLILAILVFFIKDNKKYTSLWFAIIISSSAHLYLQYLCPYDLERYVIYIQIGFIIAPLTLYSVYELFGKNLRGKQKKIEKKKYETNTKPKISEETETQIVNINKSLSQN